MDIPECFYRISIKALVLNETRDKFLIVKEENGKWELPGGGLEWGATPQEDLRREIDEEMGLSVVSVADHPSYFTTFVKEVGDPWKANLLFETVLESLEFTPSDECVEVRFVNREEAKALSLFENVTKFLELFDPARHK